MKEKAGKKKGIFSGLKGIKTEVKDLFGIDSNEESIEDTGILDFSTTDEPREEMEKPKKGKSLFGKSKPSQAAKEIFSNEEENLSNYQTIFIDPKSFGEAKKISNYIMKDKMITVNLESLDSHSAQRLMDFLAGAMRIKEASFVSISKKVYTIVPKSMKIYYEGQKDRKKSILEFEREE